ncbi:MAG: hypothetical protein UR99_C0059G0001, partial [Candidatus Moranbacteria bacterium GW2011_GWD2_36_12]
VMDTTNLPAFGGQQYFGNLPAGGGTELMSDYSEKACY